MQCELCSAQVLWTIFNSWLICNKQTINESNGHMCHGFACISQNCLNCDFTLRITLVCCNPLLSIVLILRKPKVVISCSIMWPAILIFGYCPVHTWLSQHLICVLTTIIPCRSCITFSEWSLLQHCLYNCKVANLTMLIACFLIFLVHGIVFLKTWVM